MPRSNRIARVLSTKIVGNSVEIGDQEEPRRVQVCVSPTGFARESARLQAPRAILCATGVDDQDQITRCVNGMHDGPAAED
jgi:hypothetical protein